MQPIISHRKGHLGFRGCTVALILAAVGLGACIPTTEVTKSTLPVTSTPVRTVHPLPTEASLLTKSAPPEDWPYRWLKGIPCHPPCWEGITPGQTTVKEAVEILRQSPIITTVETTTIPSRPEVGAITWNWVSSGEEGGGALFSPESLFNPIYLIHPYLPTPLKFDDIIQTYGEPSHIIARSVHNPDDTLAYDLTILYLSQGMLFSGGHGSRKLILSEDTYLSSPSFFAPTYEGLQTAYQWAETHPEWLVPWQGMKGFDFYCRNEEGNPCP